jgi:hypothetical protein
MMERVAMALVSADLMHGIVIPPEDELIQKIIAALAEAGYRAAPPTDDTLLTRKQLAAALTAAGYRTAPSSLATMATRGGGPPYQRWGPTPVYRWGEGLRWAQARLSRPGRTAAEIRRSAPRI